MEQKETQLLKDALSGNINAFQSLFAAFHDQLKSYLYRLLANRNDAEDLTHDTFIKAFDKLSSFRGESSLKTWVFQIATHLAYNQMQRHKRWTADVSEKAKRLVLENETLRQSIVHVHQSSAQAQYEIAEHIDTCFTCIAKNLPIEHQVTVILKDVYSFSVDEIGQILNKSLGSVKYMLQAGRGTMTDIFDTRCALVNKNGVCHQCSELNGWFNPKQQQQEALMQLDLVKEAAKQNKEELYQMRAKLVRAIDPLRSAGSELQEILLHCNTLAMANA